MNKAIKVEWWRLFDHNDKCVFNGHIVSAHNKKTLLSTGQGYARKKDLFWMLSQVLNEVVTDSRDHSKQLPDRYTKKARAQNG